MLKKLSLISLALAVLSLLLLGGLYIWDESRGWIATLDLLALSARFRLRGMEEPDARLKVVGITENTISAFAKQQVYYPFPRDWHALALRRLADAGARVVVLDILFSEADSWDIAEDEALRDAINYCREQGCDVVLAAAIERIEYTAGVYSQSLLTPAPTIMQASPALGLSNTLEKLSYKSTENIWLSLPLGEGESEARYFSQAVEAYARTCAQEGRDFDALLHRASPHDVPYYRINYVGRPEQLPEHLKSYELLFLDELDGGEKGVLSGENAERLARAFGNAIVFIGSRAKADNDYFNTPFGLMFGVDTNAQAYDTLARERWITFVPPAWFLLIAALLGLEAWILSLVRPIWLSVLSALGSIAVITIANVLLFTLIRIELSLTMTVAGFALPYMTCALYSGLTEEAAKHKIRRHFKRYLAPEIVDQIIANPGVADLGGVERQVAVMFNDIRNYSTITERLTPHQIVDLLNLYLGEATDIVRHNEGFVDKYLGDGLMACFGGPVPTPHPAADAINAALGIVGVLHEKVAPKLREWNVPEFRVGIGIHLGKVVMGNIGSEWHMDYTVVGDAVNVASRVESQTKEYGWAILVTREVKEAAGDSFDFEWVGERQVKGREQPVAMYRVIGPDPLENYRLNLPPL